MSLIGLQLSRDGVTFEIGELNVVNGQDVRVFSTAEGATVRLSVEGPMGLIHVEATPHQAPEVGNAGQVTLVGSAWALDGATS